nr:non-specific lipid-transfer protein 2-like [Ipomoea batatas]
MTDLRAAVVHTWERGRLDVVNNGDTEPFVQDEDSNLVAAFPWTLCTRLASERNGKVVNLAQLQKSFSGFLGSWGVEIHLQTWILEVLTEARLLLVKPLATELRWVGVGPDENCASAKSSISTATIMRLKDFILVAIDHCAVAALGRSTVFFGCMQRAAADSMPERFNVKHQKPSQLCCQRLNQRKPCFCEYLKNPNLKAMSTPPFAKKAIKTCKVSIPKC